MKTFIIVSLCLHGFATIIYIFELMANKYPEQKTETVGGIVAKTLINLGFITWASVLLYLQG
jgi:hypothetical protein